MHPLYDSECETGWFMTDVSIVAWALVAALTNVAFLGSAILCS